MLLRILNPGVLLMTLAKMWGGGPLPKEVGDSLTREGITIFPQYGWYVP